ncbi:hypothetical protein LPN01_09780 [Sphingomonas sp. A2-49]|uniref:hypothetical protein n=1 Tax=Sphingomonas sp. A2-49 TaxID=1391375 RepID=UPI0021CE4EFC|nr:hypothetical protein [Sphingomonas sp. A2-49]MCU6454369.1 hypothetical protein [Sphingomonas sp. A2-49]
MFPQANSAAEWLVLAASCEAAARLCEKDPAAAARAWNECGFAVECAVKAVIMRKEGLNAWPSRSQRPDLWHHDLRGLFAIAGIAISETDPVAPAVMTMWDWNRSHSYSFTPIPRAVIKGYIAAAFGDMGVVPWLKATYLPHV